MYGCTCLCQLWGDALRRCWAGPRLPLKARPAVVIKSKVKQKLKGASSPSIIIIISNIHHGHRWGPTPPPLCLSVHTRAWVRACCTNVSSQHTDTLLSEVHCSNQTSAFTQMTSQNYVKRGQNEQFLHLLSSANIVESAYLNSRAVLFVLSMDTYRLKTFFSSSLRKDWTGIVMA